MVYVCCCGVWHATTQPNTDVGDGPDYRVLLAHFGHVISVFKQIKPEYQTVIADITKKMGAGMAEFAEKKNVRTISDYNLYCHYVAGLVGHGLTRLFAVSGLESKRRHIWIANRRRHLI
jgi:farnesyl-diphosphate farnesyltransferase